MSAAAPVVPPPYPSDHGPGSYNDRKPATPSPSVNGGERIYSHIQDLQRLALEGYNRDSSILRLVETAERGLSQAKTLLEVRRPDLSYVEYLRASQIVVEEIPRHRQWADFQIDGHGGFQRYGVLQKKINALSEQYANIKNIIINNNKRNGVQSKRAAGGANGHVGTEFMTAPANGNDNHEHTIVPDQKTKPAPSPKPDKLHGKAISNDTASVSATDPLTERFARLRMMSGGGDTTRPSSRGSNQSSIHSSPIYMPNASDFGSRTSFDALQKTSSQLARPQGPREMPNGGAGPPVPNKLALDTNVVAAIPRAPSPTYSPARNMHTAGNIAPPRHSMRSLVSNTGRRTSMAPSSSASYQAPNGAPDSTDYFPRVASSTSALWNGTSSQEPRRKSVHVPKETRISAERLYDYLERFSILLIDCRPREDFDQGHIFTRSVICVDPFTLSQGMSADELLGRMVLSPEPEQEMLMQRDKYDLVVYYDAETQSENFLTHPTSELQKKLKFLHESLYDFNQDKPLQRPPILLIGGIASWSDLVGNQALLASHTAGKTTQHKGIQRRRLATATGSSQLRVPKRRLRDYNPLDAEEEQKWRERARAESVVLPPVPTVKEGEEGETQGDHDYEEPGSAIREFLERFPEAGMLDKKPPSGTTSPLPSRPPPELPVKVPMYPPAPPHSVYPAAPERPKPAAPRMSYTGVSERATQTASATRSASHLAPYIPPKYLSANLRLPRTGLYNYGSTCYLNATVQALSATTPLSVFFLSEDFHRQLERENRKGTNGLLTEIYANLTRSIWKGDVDYIRPATFRKFCGRLKKEWESSQQQDAKEFLDFLVDCLQEDLNRNWARNPLRVLTPAEEAKRESMPKSYVARLEWERFTHRERSYITDMFAGQHSSQLKCSICGWTSTTYEAFYSLSVEIARPRSTSGPLQIPSLDDCLRSYCQTEILEGDEQIQCGNCKCSRDATKKITLTRAPQFLIVHFKRFQTDMFGRSAKKIHAPVDFPLINFNLEPYMLPSLSESEAASMVRDWGTKAVEPTPSMTPPYTYDAYAVIRHIGATMERGHYTAAVKDRARNVWRNFDDTTVKDFQPGAGEWTRRGDLRNDEAYIVFYQRTSSTGGKM